MSSVTWCEAFGKLRGAGVPGEALRAEIADTGIAVAPFDRRDAEAASELVAATRALGLSLADRTCLALASRLAVPAVTADRAWTALDLDVAVDCIR
jgi:PIN domain nuclease of toxin-antitoxin system